jgi:hypothetical protein
MEGACGLRGVLIEHPIHDVVLLFDATCDNDCMTRLPLEIKDPDEFAASDMCLLQLQLPHRSCASPMFLTASPMPVLTGAPST